MSVVAVGVGGGELACVVVCWLLLRNTGHGHGSKVKIVRSRNTRLCEISRDGEASCPSFIQLELG